MRSHARGRAFTLIEVLLALAIVLLLSWGIFALVSNLTDRRNRLLDLASHQEQTGAFFDLVERDLMCCVAAGRAGESGVHGTATELNLSARGVTLEATGFRMAKGDRYSAGYRFDGAGGRVLLARGGGPADADEPVIENVRKAAFRYFDGRSWVAEFDSVGAGGLPAAIEISLWFGAPGADGIDPSTAGPPDRVRQIAIPDSRASGSGESR